MRQVEQFLTESNRHMESALSRSRVVITCQDRDLRYLWLFNPGKEFKHAVGKKMSEFAAPEQYAPIEAIKRRVLETGQPVQEGLRIPYKDGISTFDMTVTPTMHEGEIVGLTSVTVDLTDLLAAQEELHQANARLLGLLGDGIQRGQAVIRALR
jgi:PAS domain-containing protein